MVSFAYPGAGTIADESTLLIRPLIGMRGAFFYRTGTTK